MSFEVKQWDYSGQPELKERLLSKIRETEQFTILVDEKTDRWILVGPNDDASIAEASIMCAALNVLSNDN